MKDVESLRNILRYYLNFQKSWGIEFVRSEQRPAPGPAVQGATEAKEKKKPEEAQKKTVKYTMSEKIAALQAIEEQVKGCQKCRLHEHRKQSVCGEGNPNAELMFVGEGPAKMEDLSGKPFVGPAGQLLTKMISAMGLTRDQVYITNIVKCRPPGNRNPRDDEMDQCEPYLIRQTEIIQPKVIVTLGSPSSLRLLKTAIPISALRGKYRKYRGIKVMPTFHPAYLLRNEQEKIKVWEDLQQVMLELGIPLPGKR